MTTPPHSRPSSSLSRPSSSLSRHPVSRPSSSASNRQGLRSSASSARPVSASSGRPQSRFSQRTRSRLAKSRVNKFAPTFVTQVTGLQADDGSQEFQKIADYVVKRLEATTLNKGAVSVDMRYVEQQIKGCLYIDIILGEILTTHQPCAEGSYHDERCGVRRFIVCVQQAEESYRGQISRYLLHSF